MTATRHPLLGGLTGALGGLGNQLPRMLDLRWQLARLELESDARLLRRVGIAWAVAAVMGLTALPLLAAAAAEALDGLWGIGRAGWMLALGLLLLAAAICVGLAACRCFRRRLKALEQTREELREDLLWLGEWLSGQR